MGVVESRITVAKTMAGARSGPERTDHRREAIPTLLQCAGFDI
jgi:hypothetical protein